jgi:hypothetical protein
LGVGLGKTAGINSKVALQLHLFRNSFSPGGTETLAWKLTIPDMGACGDEVKSNRRSWLLPSLLATVSEVVLPD